MSREEKLVFFAKKHLGKPYRYGAKPSEAPKTFDCSSFAQYLYKKIGINLPRTALDQASCGKPFRRDKKALRIGDLLFIKGGWGHYNPTYPTGIGHVGIYVGNGKVINARSTPIKSGSKEIKGKEIGKVIEDPVESFLNRSDFVTIRRIL